MKVSTKLKLISAFGILGFMLGVWYWYRYTSRGVGAFLGWSILGSMLGLGLGRLISLPFKDEIDEKIDEALSEEEDASTAENKVIEDTTTVENE